MSFKGSPVNSISFWASSSETLGIILMDPILAEGCYELIYDIFWMLVKPSFEWNLKASFSIPNKNTMPNRMSSFINLFLRGSLIIPNLYKMDSILFAIFFRNLGFSLQFLIFHFGKLNLSLQFLIHFLKFPDFLFFSVPWDLSWNSVSFFFCFFFEVIVDRKILSYKSRFRVAFPIFSPHPLQKVLLPHDLRL